MVSVALPDISQIAKSFGIEEGDFASDLFILTLRRTGAKDLLQTDTFRWLTPQQATDFGIEVGEGQLVRLAPNEDRTDWSYQLWGMGEAEEVPPTVPTIAPPTAPPPVTEVETLLRDIYPEKFLPEASYGYTEEEIPDMVAGVISSWAQEDTEAFLQDLYSRGGRTPQAEQLLRLLGVLDEDMEDIFTYLDFSDIPEGGEDYIYEIEEKGVLVRKLGTLKPDGIVWVSDVPIGVVDFGTGEFISAKELERYPSDDEQRAILRRGGVSEEEIEKIIALSHLDLSKEGWLEKYKSINPSVLKNIRHSLFSRSWMTGLGTLISAGGGAAGWAGAENLRTNLTQLGETLVKERPVLEPWEPSVSTLLDPRFWMTSVTEALPFALAFIPLSIISAYGGAAVAGVASLGTFGTYLMTVIFAGVGQAVTEATFEAGGVYNEAIARGFSQYDASKAAGSTFRKNVFSLSGTNALQFFVAFLPSPIKTLNTLVSKGLVTVIRVGGKITSVALTEAGEEALQNVWERQALGDKVEWDDEMKMSALIGFAMGIPLAGAGEAFVTIQNRVVERLPEDIRAEFDAEVARFEAEGMVRDQAILMALDNIADQAEVQAITAKVLEEMTVEESRKMIKPVDKTEALVWEHIGREVAPVEEVAPTVEAVTPVTEGLQAEYTTLITQAEQVAPTNPTVIKAKDIISKITPENQRQSLIQIEALEDELKGIVTPEVTRTLSLEEVSKLETRIPLDLIRKDEAGEIARLTKEIQEKGITEPITIRVREDGSQIVWDGIHRLIVAQDLGIKNIPVRYIGEEGLPARKPPTKPKPPIAPEAGYQQLAEARAKEKGISIAQASREIAEEAIAEAPPVEVVEAPPVTEIAPRATEADIQQSKQDAFIQAPEGVDITKASSDAFVAQSAMAGLPPPNIPPGTSGHIGGGGNNSENSLYDMTNRVIPGEDAGRAALRIWAGTRKRMATEAIAWWKGGNKSLKVLGIGKTEGINQRLTKEDSYDLFKALHGEGDVPVNLQSVYDELRAFLDQESSDMLAFDPSFSRVLMAHPDYFPRGWKPPREGRYRLGAKPGFLKPRIDATFTEMVESGWEPISWNPYDMAALRRVAGTEYREGQILIKRLKTFSKAIAEHDAPKEGWRVPRVGPAFEGKPYVSSDGQAYMTPKVSVPNRVADVLESTYGVRVEFRVGGVDVFAFIRGFGAITKRMKLFGSLFQHVDFLTRDFVTTFTPEGIRHAEPLKFPALAARVTASAVSPNVRGKLEQRILSGEPLYNDSTISLKMIADAGWEMGQDEMLIRRDVREQLESIVRETEEVSGWKQIAQTGAEIASPVTRRLSATARFFEAGLFDGVYRESQAYALEHVIVPRLKRLHPDWTDSQIVGSAAEEVNKQFSTLAVWQSVLQQPAAREVARALFFSFNESESWIRQITSAVKGENRVYWREYTVATFIALAVAANVINLISEGEFLPPDRYVPIVLGSSWSSMPWGIAYNDKFLSPRLPWNGRNEQPLYLDIVGQADTYLRWMLDPGGALTARYNVLPRAVMNQVQGEDFWGRQLEDWDDRVKQAILDLFMPIGAGNIAEATRQIWPPVAGILPEQEGRIGIVGALIQATGLNVRAQKTMDMLDRYARDSGLLKADGTPVESWDDLEPIQKRELEKTPELQIELGLRSATGLERQYPGAEGFGKLDELDQERFTRGEALIAELVAALKGVDRTEAFNIARNFRNEVSRLKKEISDRKAQVSADFQLFKETGVLPEDPNQRALVEYYNIFDKATKPSGVMDWDLVNELDAELREKWTPEQEGYVDRNTGITEWGPLMQEFVNAQRVVSDSGYWDVPERDRKLFRLQHPEIEDILTGKFYNYKPIEGEAEKISLKWQDVYRHLDALKDMGLTDEEMDEQKGAIYNENPGFWEDDRRKIAWNAVGDLLDEDRTLVVVEEFVEYSRLVETYGANSAEAKLFRYDSKELNALGIQEGTFSSEGWSELDEADVERWRIDVEMSKLDETSEEYISLKQKKQGYSEGFTKIDEFVEYSNLPKAGFRQERYLVEHPEFAKEMKTIRGIEPPDYIPPVEYDELLEKEDKTPEDLHRIKAYEKKVPQAHIDNYVSYYSLEKPEGQDLWYEDDWFLMENMDFYKEVYLGILKNVRADFRTVPTRRVFGLYLNYLELPLGAARRDYRRSNDDLDRWLQLKFGYTPITGGAELEDEVEESELDKLLREIEEKRKQLQ